MATTLELNYSNTTLDLSAAEGAGLRFLKWFPMPSRMDNQVTGEVITVMADRRDDSDDDTLASDLQSLYQMRRRAMEYIQEPWMNDPVWLHAQMEDETGERRALVHSIDWQWMSDGVGDVGYPAAHSAKLQIRIERGPWEHPTAQSADDMSETSGAAIKWDYTAGDGADIVGDMPARIVEMRVQSDASGAHVGRLWLGLRGPDGHGAFADFLEIWELEVDNAYRSTDVSRAEDASASNTTTESPTDYTKIRVSESGLDWDDGDYHPVTYIALEDIVAATTDPEDNYGDFLWLVRAQCSDLSTTWLIQARFGYSGMDNNDRIRAEPVAEVDNNIWDYYVVGRMPIPLRNLHALSTSVLAARNDLHYEVQLFAQRTAGTGDLDLDCLIPLPIDDGWLYIEDFVLAAGTDESVYFSEGPDGGADAISGSDFEYRPIVHAHNFRLPVGDGRMIIVYASPTISDITTGIIIPAGGLQYVPRWGDLRGEE